MTEPANTKRPWDVYDGWSETTPSDWRSAVAVIAEHLAEDVPYTEEARQRAWRLLSDVQPQRLHFDLEDAMHEYVWHTISIGAALGYALAQTWTGRLEDLTTWPERARVYAALDDWGIETALQRRDRERQGGSEGAE